MKLVLGVVDMPYSHAATSPRTQGRGGRKRPVAAAAARGSTTTGDVAEILERRYGVMAMFSLLHGADIIEGLEEAMQDKLENLLMGAPLTPQLFPEGSLSSIEQAFRGFLDNREMDGRAQGVPTEAAERGVSHRMARPYARRGARPSFIDTGQYQASMRAWVDE